MSLKKLIKNYFLHEMFNGDKDAMGARFTEKYIGYAQSFLNEVIDILNSSKFLEIDEDVFTYSNIGDQLKLKDETIEQLVKENKELREKLNKKQKKKRESLLEKILKLIGVKYE